MSIHVDISHGPEASLGRQEGLAMSSRHRPLTGWARCFSIGQPSKARCGIGWHVVGQVHHFIERRETETRSGD